MDIEILGRFEKDQSPTLWTSEMLRPCVLRQCCQSTSLAQCATFAIPSSMMAYAAAAYASNTISSLSHENIDKLPINGPYE